MPKEIVADFVRKPPNNPQNRQEVTLLAKKPPTVSSAKKLIENLFNFPEQIIDFGSFCLDQLEVGFERFRLQNDPVFCGKEKPQGDGFVIVILPGFATLKSFYSDPEIYFKNSGLRVQTFFPGIVNLGSFQNLLEDSLNFLKTQSQLYQKKLHVLGHSLGGYIMRIAAEDYSDELKNYLESLFLVGAPIPARINLVVETAFLLSQLPFGLKNLDELLARFQALKENVNLGQVEVFEIASWYDAICTNGRRETSNRAYFKSSHAGLLIDPDVLGFVKEKISAKLKLAT